MEFIFLAIILASFHWSASWGLESRKSPFDNVALQRYEIWANLALSYVRNLTCDRAFFAVPDQCKQMKQTPKDRMQIFSAEAGKHRKLMATLPDGTLSRSGLHDGIVIIDPFPVASYGHLVVAFFVDRLDRVSCELYGGIYIDNHNDCLRLALKDGCHNLLTRQQRYENYVQRHATHKLHRCEIDSLPYVYEVPASNPSPMPARRMDDQKLQCKEANGFARCPSMIRIRNPISIDQDPNTHVRCRLLEICDHAIIVHSNWGRSIWKKGDYELLLANKRMLTENGFPNENIKIFYKNGLKDEDADTARSYGRRMENDTNTTLYPAKKQFIRSHIQNACSRSHCIDTLVIFLRGSALYDGSLLLFDTNEDGVASDEEKYTIQEIVRDLINCMARRVYLVADYSYSGRLTSALREEQIQNYENLMVITSGNEEQYSWNNQFTRILINSNHRSNCFKNIFLTNKDLITNSNPSIFDGSGDDDNIGTTIFGAPCNSSPINDEELREKYLGCNNVPAWIWFQTASSNATASPAFRNRSRK